MAYGPLIGSPEYSSDVLPILDPVKNVATTFKAPVRDPQMPINLGPGHAAAVKPLHAVAVLGRRSDLGDARQQPQLDVRPEGTRLAGRVGARQRQSRRSAGEGSTHPSAKVFPLDRAIRHLAILDPKTQKYTFVDTCFSTHHLQFGYDANDTLWTSGGGPVVGWLNTKMFDETGDAAKSQGWTPLVLDTNGNGKRDAFVEPDAPPDPAKDTRINAPFYAVMPSPVDGSVWGAVMGVPGAVVRIAPGANPSEHRARRNLSRAAARVRRARRRHRFARASCGCRSAAVISAASIAASATVR